MGSPGVPRPYFGNHHIGYWDTDVQGPRATGASSHMQCSQSVRPQGNAAWDGQRDWEREWASEWDLERERAAGV